MMSTRMRELEMKEGKPSSKSLLANVLDMDDDFRLVFKFCIYGSLLKRGLLNMVLQIFSLKNKPIVNENT